MSNTPELDKLINSIGMTRQEASVSSYSSIFGKDPALEEAEKIFVDLAAGMSESAKLIALCATELNMNGYTEYQIALGAGAGSSFKPMCNPFWNIGEVLPLYIDTLSEIKIEKDLIVGKKGDRIFQQPKKFYCKGKY